MIILDAFPLEGEMMVIFYILVVMFVLLFAAEFLFIMSDKMPWNRREKK